MAANNTPSQLSECIDDGCDYFDEYVASFRPMSEMLLRL